MLLWTARTGHTPALKPPVQPSGYNLTTPADESDQGQIHDQVRYGNSNPFILDPHHRLLSSLPALALCPQTRYDELTRKHGWLYAVVLDHVLQVGHMSEPKPER